VGHDPKQIDPYVRLANLLRKRSEKLKDQPPSPPDSPKAEASALVAEADRHMDEMVSQKGGDYRAHLARWQYRREWEFRKMDLKSLAESKKLAEAGRDVTSALALAPKEAEVLLAAAEWDRLRREPASAQSHLETGLKLHPQDARLHRALALLDL